ncbi:hypothetical protein RhiirA5_365597 [Rhizophagus irregularis]|uniref:Uncharacterized protein n=5 Tax=Rhizophagus irregularis TaxID=588596 RepID=A0A2I1F9M3_9GLOM|nr:hypothetical protein RhiirA5_365597 [Rhizophagus irregularis]GBC44599.1 hypothetical protein GLOIN_2v1784985 [Rhizophagus irregularis DAOM 181602=DAOM 197198]PKY31080.1 hypothetical protein RhiirB3_419271 [Rhizophagus irregularis]CAB4480850.1 unnamed protein product [Rhizophagus irregularis]CAB5179340.1 unnamed protein product [Rhizophagus irregularis]
MDEEISLKELKDKRLKVARAFRLKNLKRVADKNLALYKIARKNTLQAIIFSIATILFGTIFIFVVGNSGITKIVENSVTGVASLMTLLLNLRSFMTPSTDDDNIAIKFSEVSDESVELSLKTTDEDDIRNTENTIELWCGWLLVMRSFYTTFTMFSSLLLIVFIILDFTLQQKNVVPINTAIIIFGLISLILAGLIRYSLKLFTLTGDGGKDIERLLNGIQIHIKRNTAIDLENLLQDYFKPCIIKDVDRKESKIKKFFEKSALIKFITGRSQKKEKFEKKLIKHLTDLNDKNNAEKQVKVENNLNDVLDGGKYEKRRGEINELVKAEKVKVEEVNDMKVKAIAPKPADISLWIWKLYTAMEGLDFILQKNTNCQSELNMKKLMKKLSLKELVEIILKWGDQKYLSNPESTKLSVDYHILRELYGASKELLNLIEKENEKKNGQSSKEESDEIEEFFKISKKLEVINQIIEKSKTLHTEEFTEFTDELFKELGGIKERLEYINRWAENLNNFTDPTSAQVDQLREEIPKILNCKNLEEYDNIWDKIQTSKQGNTKQTQTRENTKLEKITNLPLILCEIEKELSRTTEILKEIDQKIETPIEDLGYAKIVHRCSDSKLGEIEKKLFEMHDNIRQDLMNKDDNDTAGGNIDKIEKKLREVFIGKELSNNTLVENIKEFNDKISKKLSNDSQFKTEKAKGFIVKFLDKLDEIEEFYKIIDELKKETRQKISRDESKELNELLESLLEELHQISEELILKKFIELRNENKYTKLHKGLSELRVFTKFKKLHELFKEINQKIFDSIRINYSAHLVNDIYFFKHLYHEILDSIKEVEYNTKLNPIDCYIDFGKHFGTHLFQHFIPDGKKRGSYQKINQILIRCYYRLGELLFSDNNGENAPKKVTDLQHRKAKNIYELYNKMLLIYNDNNNDNKLPLYMIKEIKSRYAATIFALSNDDVEYLIRTIRAIKSDPNKEGDKSNPDAKKKGKHKSKKQVPEVVILE